MLRREFLKSASMVLSGLLIVNQIPLLPAKAQETKNTVIKRNPYRFNGNAKAGCAYPPEIASMMEYGSMATPF